MHIPPRSAGVRFPVPVLIFLVVPGVALATASHPATLATLRSRSDVSPREDHRRRQPPARLGPHRRLGVVAQGRPELRRGRSAGCHPPDQAAAVHHRGGLRAQEGDRRGRYELVVTVEETRPIFADVRSRGWLGADPFVSELPNAQRRLDLGDSSLLGLREFVGSTGLVFATPGVERALSPGGLYPLWALRRRQLRDHCRGLRSAQVTTPIPLALGRRGAHRQPVAPGDRVEAQIPARAPAPSDGFENRSAELDWLYNTTDDPFFATRGQRGRGGGVYQSFDDRYRSSTALRPRSALTSAPSSSPAVITGRSPRASRCFSTSPGPPTVTP